MYCYNENAQKQRRRKQQEEDAARTAVLKRRAAEIELLLQQLRRSTARNTETLGQVQLILHQLRKSSRQHRKLVRKRSDDAVWDSLSNIPAASLDQSCCPRVLYYNQQYYPQQYRHRNQQPWL
uniref:Uncharacterized protein n=1 Tax=Trichogramma kaykai TaxID=54128 RepID=A0ABD2VV38_9HYME